MVSKYVLHTKENQRNILEVHMKIESHSFGSSVHSFGMPYEIKL